MQRGFKSEVSQILIVTSYTNLVTSYTNLYFHTAITTDIPGKQKKAPYKQAGKKPFSQSRNHQRESHIPTKTTWASYYTVHKDQSNLILPHTDDVTCPGHEMSTRKQLRGNQEPNKCIYVYVQYILIKSLCTL